jgi:predicted TIM-barrel fold metal-dependent hydrolase
LTANVAAGIDIVPSTREENVRKLGLALEELKRACDNGAIGVMVLANISGQHLTDEAFKGIWAEIDRRGLPVLVHPSAPPGSRELGMHEFQLTAPIGFTFDTSLAVARCIYDGFFDRYPNLKLIASHGGGAPPMPQWALPATGTRCSRGAGRRREGCW